MLASELNSALRESNAVFQSMSSENKQKIIWGFQTNMFPVFASILLLSGPSPSPCSSFTGDSFKIPVHFVITLHQSVFSSVHFLLPLK